jgi:hypothetical protein
VTQLLVRDGGYAIYCPICRKFSLKGSINQSPLVREVLELLENINISKTSEDGKALGNKVDKPDASDNCSEHELPIECYCVECRKLLCARCVVRDHRRHDIQTLEETLTAISEEANGYLRQMQIKSDCMKVNQSITERNINHVEETKDKAIKCIKEHADKQRGKLNEDEQALILEVQQKADLVLDTLKQDRNNQEKEITSLETLDVWGSTTIQSGSALKAIEEFHGGLLQRLKNSSQAPLPEKTKICSHIINFAPSEFNILDNSIGSVNINTYYLEKKTSFASSLKSDEQSEDYRQTPQPDVGPKTVSSSRESTESLLEKSQTIQSDFRPKTVGSSRESTESLLEKSQTIQPDVRPKTVASSRESIESLLEKSQTIQPVVLRNIPNIFWKKIKPYNLMSGSKQLLFLRNLPNLY